MPEGRIHVFLGCQNSDDCEALALFLPNETRPVFEEDCPTKRLRDGFDEMELIEPPDSVSRFEENGLILNYDGLELEELADVEDKNVRDYLQSLYRQLQDVGVDEFITAFETLEGYIMYEQYYHDSEPTSLDDNEELGKLKAQTFEQNFSQVIKHYSTVL